MSDVKCAETEETFYIGVDVGTGSVRAALVNNLGKIIKLSTNPIQTWNPKPDFYEQSSEDIWLTCCKTIKEICKDVDPANVKGIGFDATCSLVVLDTDGNPVTVSPTGNAEQNIILWMDHRAEAEANLINSTKHSILLYYGGKISLEMEIPKLLWLKKNLTSECWNNAGLFFDLPDFLTWKATGAESRSLCSLVCKWAYEIQADGSGGWNSQFFGEIGLEDLLEDNYKKIGHTVLPPGSPCGIGLIPKVAEILGLRAGTPVGTSIIDAHAGGLGMIGCSAKDIPLDFNTRIGLICGTSTCHMAVSKTPNFVTGVWGPYFSAMIPNMWLNEGGQSATGKLVDHIIESHPAFNTIKDDLHGTHIQKYLNNVLEEMAAAQELSSIDFLTNDLHIWPDFHGNRSPLANPNIKGMISGMTLATDKENLAILYLATIQALAYGTKHIMDVLKQSGYNNIASMVICGGLSKNPLFIQTQADVVNIPILCPNEPESVLLGSAILGACAAGTFCDMNAAIQAMAGGATVVYPNPNVKKYHKKKYKVFLKMVKHQEKYSLIMNNPQ